MYFTLGQAAKATGKSKGTISKHLTSGKLSYVSKSKAGYQIEASELFRVFPKNGSNEGLQNKQKTPNLEIEHLKLTLELDAAREKIKMLEENHQNTLSDRDHWREQAQKLALPKPNMTEPTSQPAASSKNGMWAWLTR